MAYTSPGFESILAGILRDIRSLQSEADIGTDSDHYVRSAAVSAAIEGIYQKLSWLYRQVFDDTSDDEELLHKAALRGLFLKPATFASAPAEISGAAGAELLQGATLKHVASGALLVAGSSVTIDASGSAVVTVRAQTPGVAQNGLSGALIITSPPLGIDTAAMLKANTAGGEDQEAVASLRARYLELVRNPPAGGAEYDYARWAKEVPGVSGALVMPLRRGSGTVDIAITGSNGSPSAAVVAACLAHIESVCSVIADIGVFAPIEHFVDSTAKVELASGYTLAGVQLAANAAYLALLGALKPGETLKRSQIEGMITNLAGVTDRVLLTPAANVGASDDPAAIGWIRPGVITLELMP